MFKALKFLECVIRRMQFRCAKFSKLERKGDRFETSLAKFVERARGRPPARVACAFDASSLELKGGLFAQSD
jgi:hypothetical protein